jgi:hypothetical protein
MFGGLRGSADLGTGAWKRGQPSGLTAIDMFMGGDHNLFPIEWTIYAFYALPSTVGAILGRAIRKQIIW